MRGFLSEGWGDGWKRAEKRGCIPKGPSMFSTEFQSAAPTSKGIEAIWIDPSAIGPRFAEAPPACSWAQKEWTAQKWTAQKRWTNLSLQNLLCTSAAPPAPPVVLFPIAHLYHNAYKGISY